MTITPTATVSTKGLEDAIRERLKYPGRTEAEAVNTAAYWIAVNTKNATPFASIESMDSDLDRFTTPTVTVDSEGKAVISKRQKRQFGRIGGKALLATGKRVPLAALIVAKRASGSYTGNPKWKLDKNPFKGVSPARGAAAMTKLIEKMFKGRHSSAHFLQSGWVKAVKILRGFKVGSYRQGTNPNQDSKFDYDLAVRGEATPAREGSDKVFSQIVNNTGETGFNRIRVDEALQQYGAAPLQAAVDRESDNLLEYVARKNAEKDAKFNRMAS